MISWKTERRRHHIWALRAAASPQIIHFYSALYPQATELQDKEETCYNSSLEHQCLSYARKTTCVVQIRATTLPICKKIASQFYFYWPQVLHVYCITFNSQYQNRKWLACRTEVNGRRHCCEVQAKGNKIMKHRRQRTRKTVTTCLYIVLRVPCHSQLQSVIFTQHKERHHNAIMS